MEQQRLYLMRLGATAAAHRLDALEGAERDFTGRNEMFFRRLNQLASRAAWHDGGGPVPDGSSGTGPAQLGYREVPAPVELAGTPEREPPLPGKAAGASGTIC
ncbi:MAG TPA: hypothetical protein VM689_06235 [Aliidongia sp.]|nr:hypothetical protein [Aliidongia sp.]